ncbi:MAG: hypothetical protein ACLPX8_25240 [Bryobacteraceae bacterium]|jgi:hypothetical protein
MPRDTFTFGRKRLESEARRMNRNARIFCFLVLTLAALGGCSSQPPAKESKKAGTVPDRIQGKAQVLVESGGATDAALNAGGPSMYLWEGTHRYRLFLRTAVEVVHGSEYTAEGVYAQKAIDEIGDPDQVPILAPLDIGVPIADFRKHLNQRSRN